MHQPTSLTEQLGKAILKLEAHECAANDSVQWMEIEEHLSHVETIMKEEVEELEVREKEFKHKESETHTLLSEREAAVAAKEQDLLDRIQELKDATVAVIAEAWANHKPASLEPIENGDGKESKFNSNHVLDLPIACFPFLGGYVSAHHHHSMATVPTLAACSPPTPGHQQ